MNTENNWLVVARLLQNSGTRLPQLMNTSGFHQNVGEGKKSLNAMSLASYPGAYTRKEARTARVQGPRYEATISPDPLLSEALSKGSGCARLTNSSSFIFVERKVKGQ